MSDKRQGEGFYEEGGRKADAAIHDPIIAGADPAGVQHHKFVSFQLMIEAGVDPQQAAQMLGIQGGFDMSPGSLA